MVCNIPIFLSTRTEDNITKNRSLPTISAVSAIDRHSFAAFALLLGTCSQLANAYSESVDSRSFHSGSAKCTKCRLYYQRFCRSGHRQTRRSNKSKTSHYGRTITFIGRCFSYVSSWRELRSAFQSTSWMCQAWLHRHSARFHLSNNEKVFRLPVACAWRNFQFWSFHWLCSFECNLDSCLAELRSFLYRRNSLDYSLRLDLRVLRPWVWQEARAKKHSNRDGTRTAQDPFSTSSNFSWLFCSGWRCGWIGSTFLPRSRRSGSTLRLVNKNTRHGKPLVLLG